MLVCDVSDVESIYNIQHWLCEIDRFSYVSRDVLYING